ncbi:MAG TPA: pyridoxamine 5'-phosphate oxidase family protein [Candidatus Acidoferrum sp.]|nr:pyridoxamine 5'-phosphate oxidase family protein [Candidatus Acidoferrum sp.]
MSRPIFSDETPNNMTREQMVAKVAELIKDINVAMMTTEAEDGLMHSRPMATQKTEFDGTLWFFTGLSTGKISEIDWNPEVNLSYSDGSANKYVSVSGTAEIVDDRAKKEELWSDIYKAWFPQGLDDPDLCLMKVEVTFAEYWDVPSGKMVQAFGFLKALATGERLKMEGESHGVVEIPSGKARAAVIAGANAARELEE